MLDAQAYLRIVRASALYDLIVTAPFATPWTFALLGSLLAGIDAALGLPGSIEAPQGLALLMGNLMGSVVLVWSVARFLFAAWQIHALTNGMSWVVLPFLAVEIGMGIAQSLSVRRTMPA